MCPFFENKGQIMSFQIKAPASQKIFLLSNIDIKGSYTIYYTFKVSSSMHFTRKKVQNSPNIGDPIQV